MIAHSFSPLRFGLLALAPPVLVIYTNLQQRRANLPGCGLPLDNPVNIASRAFFPTILKIAVIEHSGGARPGSNLLFYPTDEEGQ